MTRRNCWVRNIRDLWCSCGWLALACQPLQATALETLARAHQEKSTPLTHAALSRFAVQHAGGRDGALALLSIAAVDLEKGNWTGAAKNFRTAGSRFPLLADFAWFGEAKALAGMKSNREAVAALRKVVEATPASPNQGWAALLGGNLLVAEGDAPHAVRWLREFERILPQPHGNLALGLALEAADQAGEAVAALRDVFYQHPRSEEAQKADVALTRLRAAMGSRYPQPAAAHVLARAPKLMEAGDTKLAGQELTEGLEWMGGEDRQLAQVRLAELKYFAKDTVGALSALQAVEAEGEADAERLYYLMLAARRLERWTDFDSSREKLDQAYPRSRWRAEGLLAAANRHLVTNHPDRYEPLYTACYSDFPDHPQAGFCHWRVAWIHYVRDRADAERMMKEQLEQWPASDDAPAAMFFLGRQAEQRGDPRSAKAYYEALVRLFPNYYYGVSARDRMATDTLARVSPSPEVALYLRNLSFPAPIGAPDFAQDAQTLQRIERARLLASAALDDWATIELRFGARTDAKPAVMAMELAQLATRRGDVDQGIRFIKSLAPSYLRWGIDQAPLAFWKLAFPMPYRDSLEKHALTHSLDSRLVAGLIRQESEFDPKAVSRQKAIGLTQVRPLTGREISRKVGIKAFRTALLYQPDVNLKIGTYYLRQVLNRFETNWVAALAAYNAGPSRAVNWLGWGQYREPNEFIETIPFHETRNYVQIVLRNADFYRRIYGAGAEAARGR